MFNGIGISVIQLLLVCFLDITGVVELQPGNVIHIDTAKTGGFCSGDFVFVTPELIRYEAIIDHEYMHMKQYSRLREKFFILVAAPSAVSYWIGYLAIMGGADSKQIITALKDMPWEKENYVKFKINS